MRRGSWGLWKFAGALACVLAAGVFTCGAAIAAAPDSHGGNGAAAGGGQTTATHPSKGDEPGRGAGGTEHDEGCAPGHDTDRGVDDGHACHHAAAPATAGAVPVAPAPVATGTAQPSSAPVPSGGVHAADSPLGTPVGGMVDAPAVTDGPAAAVTVAGLPIASPAQLISAGDAAVVSHSSLPFTGRDVAIAALIGFALVLLGGIAWALGGLGDTSHRPFALH